MTITTTRGRTVEDVRELVRNLPARQPGRVFSWDEWKDNGACKGMTEEFYAVELFPNRSAERVRHIQTLRGICANCPVFKECDELGRVEEYGFLAGLTEDERRKRNNREKKSRYRERKDAGLV